MDTFATCPQCNGKGNFEGGGNRWNYCYDCHGTGKIKAAQHHSAACRAQQTEEVMSNEVLIKALELIARTDGGIVELNAKSCYMLAKSALEEYAAQQSVRTDGVKCTCGWWADVQVKGGPEICLGCGLPRR